MNMRRYLLTIGPRKIARRLADGKPKHHRDARAQQVCVDEPDTISGLLQREREIHADGQLADAAFAAAYGNVLRPPEGSGDALGRASVGNRPCSSSHILKPFYSTLQMGR